MKKTWWKSKWTRKVVVKKVVLKRIGEKRKKSIQEIKNKAERFILQHILLSTTQQLLRRKLFPSSPETKWEQGLHPRWRPWTQCQLSSLLTLGFLSPLLLLHLSSSALPFPLPHFHLIQLHAISSQSTQLQKSNSVWPEETTLKKKEKLTRNLLEAQLHTFTLLSSVPSREEILQSSSAFSITEPIPITTLQRAANPSTRPRF